MEGGGWVGKELERRDVNPSFRPSTGEQGEGEGEEKGVGGAGEREWREGWMGNN